MKKQHHHPIEKDETGVIFFLVSMNVLDLEREMGIESFYSHHPGVKGTLRTIPSDFRVIEVPNSIDKKAKGRFSIARITAENWETNHLVHMLSKRLHISRKRISFAGTKDKRAVSTQYFSFYKVTPEQIRAISLSDVLIEETFYSDTALRIGDLQGNCFQIVIRDIDSGIDLDQLNDCFTPFQKIGGFPNFFGVQRFGIIRPITHIVGRAIVDGDFEKAVMIYLCKVFDKEDKESSIVRKNLSDSGDVKKAFHEFPNRLQFEKAMLNHLIAHPDDWKGALTQLPKNLITMFVYAYQSYLFNRMLSKRIDRALPIHQAVKGDIILPVRNGHIADEHIPVTGDNIDKVNTQLKRRKAFVSGILLGSDTSFSSGEMGDIEQSVILEEGIDHRDFIIPELPMASSYGTRRALFAPINNLSYDLVGDTIHEKKKAVTASFQLSKGCYATSFIREIMKASDITNY